jgi:hypothetical protein
MALSYQLGIHSSCKNASYTNQSDSLSPSFKIPLAIGGPLSGATPTHPNRSIAFISSLEAYYDQKASYEKFVHHLPK